MSTLETHVATRKDHRCSLCGRRIPVGARYFSRPDQFPIQREHTNCADFAHEAMLHADYNEDRSKGEVKWGDTHPEGVPI